MFTGYQVLTMLFQFVVTIVAVWGVVRSSQTAMKSELQGSIEDLRLAHAKSLDESRGQFSSINKSFGEIALQINTLLEGDVRELQSRVGRLESGQDEWTKTLRHRSHDLAGRIDVLTLKVDRLERPGAWPPVGGGSAQP